MWLIGSSILAGIGAGIALAGALLESSGSSATLEIFQSPGAYAVSIATPYAALLTLTALVAIAYQIRRAR